MLLKRFRLTVLLAILGTALVAVSVLALAPSMGIPGSEPIQLTVKDGLYSLSAKQVRAGTVFKQLEDVTGVDIQVDEKLLQSTLDIDVKGATLEELFEALRQS